jgi:hypothetical protein
MGTQLMMLAQDLAVKLWAAEEYGISWHLISSIRYYCTVEGEVKPSEQK